MKANGNFSDASVERFCSGKINRMMSPSELARPCNSLFEYQVVVVHCSRHFRVCTYSPRNSHLPGINNAK